IVKDIVPISDEEDPFSVLAERLGSDVKSIGLEMGVVSMLRHQQMQKAFSNASFEDVQPELNRMRQKKSLVEVEYMQEAVDLIEILLGERMMNLKVRMTEAVIVGYFELFMYKYVVDRLSFCTVVLAGEKVARPLGVFGDRACQEVVFLLFDFVFAMKNVYSFDI